MLTHIKRRLALLFKRQFKELQNSKLSDPDKILYRAAFSIFRIALKDPSAILLASSLNDKRIIKLESKGIYIVINRFTVEITNHNFSYHLDLGVDIMNKIIRMFDNKLNNTLLEEEAQFKDQRSLGLLNVLDIMVYDV